MAPQIQNHLGAPFPSDGKNHLQFQNNGRWARVVFLRVLPDHSFVWSGIVIRLFGNTENYPIPNTSC